MIPNEWLSKHFDGEFFSGNFNHLKKIINRLGLYPKNSRIITVAGTNGKGQTVRILNKLLTSCGNKTLLLTSPHISVVNERFIVNDQQVSDSNLIYSFENVYSHTKNEKLSYFEFLYLVYLDLAQKFQPDFLIQEVGLGGRLDATNAIDADISALTSISRDHQDLLGSTYKKILFEKLGIARSGRPLITALELSYLRDLTKAFARSKQVEWFDLFHNNILNSKRSFPERNLELARAIFESATGNEAELRATDASISLFRNKEIDGASWDLYTTHNVDGLRKLIQFLGYGKYNNYNTIVFAPGRRNDADLHTMMRILLNHFDKQKITLVHFEHLKALEFSRLLELGNKFGITIVEDIKKISIPRSRGPVLVLGSNYFLGTFQ